MENQKTKVGGGKLQRGFYDFRCKIYHALHKNSKPKKLTYRTLKKNLFVYSMLSVAIINFLVFWLYVNLNSILMAFQTNVLGNIRWNFDNFKIMFDEFVNPNSVLRQSLVNTMIFFCTNLFLKVPLTFLFSYFLYKKIAGYKFFRFVFFLPSIISAVVLTTLIKYMVGPDGPLPMLYEIMFNKTAPLFLANSDHALWVILIYGIWAGFGVNIILFQGAMSRIPPELIEVGKLEGLGMGKEMTKVVIPLVWPTVSTVIVLAFVGIFTSSGEILLFTQGKFNTYTISYLIFDMVQGVGGVKNFEYASAVGLFFSLVALPIVLIVKFVLEKVSENVEY